VVSLILQLSGKEFQALALALAGSWTSVTEATFTKFRYIATFHVGSGVGGPQTGLTAGLL